MHAEQVQPPQIIQQTDSCTPAAMAPVERAAHRLNEHYRRRTLAECQHAVARMHGHADWRAMSAAVAAGAQASPYDEDVTGEVVIARRTRQRDIALELLAGVTDEVAQRVTLLHRALAAPGAHSIAQRHDPEYNRRRIERARYAYDVAYAGEAVEAARPSAREGACVPRDDDDVDLIYRVDLLPRALKAWIAQHRPLLAGWGEVVGAMRVRQRCATDLLEFSFAWGELSLQHGIDIPKGLQVYPIALCAQWYAWTGCLAAPELKADLALLDARHATDAERARAHHAVQQAIRVREAAFLMTQPREDFAALSTSAREQQMHAGHSTVRRYMSEAASEYTIKAILGKPSWLAPVPALVAR